MDVDTCIPELLPHPFYLMLEGFYLLRQPSVSRVHRLMGLVALDLVT